MSKRVLSFIKPAQCLKPKSSLNPYYPANYWKTANVVCEIIHTREHWEREVETHLVAESIDAAEVAPLVFDQIRDVELGVKFYDWVANRKYCLSLDEYGYSSFLSLLATNKAFTEVENVLSCLRTEGILPTCKALNVLIRAYSESGLLDKALDCYGFFKTTYGCLPNVVASNSLLDALTKCGRVGVARKVYDEMAERARYDNECLDDYSTCIMVRTLCWEGKVEEGRKMIEDRWGRGCVPNVVFYNTLIHGYIKKDEISGALRLFEELKLKGHLPTVETYGPLICGFCKEGNFTIVDEVLADMKTRGLIVNVEIYNTIIEYRYRQGCLVEPLVLIREMLEGGCDPDIVTFNILIKGLCSCGKVVEAENLLQIAKNKGLSPDKYSYTPLINYHCKHDNIDRATQLLVEMTERGHKPDMVTYGALIHGLVIQGEVDAAINISEKMIERGITPDSEIYNVLISGLCRKGMLSSAKKMLAEMFHRNALPDEFVFATLIDGFIRNGKFMDARRLFELSVENGMNPGIVGYNAMIKGYCKSGLMMEAESCLKKMVENCIFPDQFTYSTLIDGYIKQHDMGDALKMLADMVKRKCKPNVVTYTSLVDGYCRQGDHVAAEKTWRTMQLYGVEPNVVTYSIIIGALCKGNKLAKAAMIFHEMLKNKCIPNDCTFNYLVNGLVNNVHALRSVEDIISQDDSLTEEHSCPMLLEFFRTLVSDAWLPTAAAYNSILLCLCHHGLLKIALQLNEKLIAKGILPDPVTLLALLHAICLEGKRSEWRNFIPWNLNERELHVAIKYLGLLGKYLTPQMLDEVLSILHSQIEEWKFVNQAAQRKASGS